MIKTLTTTLVVVCLVLSVVAGEKPDTGKVEPYLLVQQATLNSGKGELYMSLLRQYKEAATSLNAETYWLAASGITGDSRQVAFVTPIQSFGQIEKEWQISKKIFHSVLLKNASFETQAGEAEQFTHSTLWKYSPELSYMPEKVEPEFATHWMVYTFRLKPGTISSFSELVRERTDLIKKGMIDEHWIAYQSIAGPAGPTMLFVVPLRSLADLDLEQVEAWKNVMTPLVRSQLESTLQNTVVSMEAQLLMLKPELSRPTPRILAANPDFWTVKEPVTTAEKKGKKAKKAEPNVGQ